MTWVVVAFLDENSVEAVPKNWLLNNNKDCFWPSYDATKLRTAILKCEEPQDCWKVHQVRVLGKGKVFDNLEKARRNAVKAESTSDLNSEIEGQKRLIVRKSKRLLFETSDEASSSDTDDYQNRNLPTVPPNLQEDEFETQKSARISTRDVRISSKKQTASPDPLLMESFRLPSSDFARQDAAFQKHVLKLLNTINVKLENISDDINKWKMMEFRSVQTNTGKSKPKDSIWEKFSFPLQDTDNLAALEEFLSNKHSYEQFVSELSTVGGINYKNMVKRIMFKLFSSKITIQYSWIGFKGKKKFSTLIVSKAITETVRVIHHQITEAEIETAIKLWLVKSKERLKLHE